MRFKKSQMKMAETIFILIIFFFLVGLGLIFYSKVQKATTTRISTEITVERAKAIAQRASTLPETRCSRRIVRPNCFDLLKAQALSDYVNSPTADTETILFYRNLFGDSLINLVVVYPEHQSLILYDESPENFTSYDPTYTPVSIYDPTRMRFVFGYLEIGVYT